MNFRVMCLLGLLFTPISILYLAIARLLLAKKYYIFTISNQYYGHMAQDTEMRLVEAGNNKVIAALRDPISVNIALEEMIRAQIDLWPRILVLPLVVVLRRLPFCIANWLGYTNWGKYREFSRHPILGGDNRCLKLTDEQQLEELDILEKFGLKSKSYFCIAIRDGEFHAGESGQEDEAYRNLDFSLFMPMIKEMNKLSIQFVRVGRKSKRPFESTNLIDYTYSLSATDLADLVLLKNSLGLINSGDGISAVATVLNIPILYINHTPWEILCTFSPKNWIVPALFLDRSCGGIATAGQVFNYKQLALTSSAYRLRGLEIIQPTSDEIKAYSKEFIQFCISSSILNANCAPTLTAEHMVKNEKFWLEYKNRLPKYALNFHKKIKSIAPESFLSKHSNIWLS